MHLVALLETAQDCDGVVDRRRRNHHLLEPPLECRVFLDVLAELVERRRANHPQFAAGKKRLEHVARIHRTFAPGARTDNGMHLVDEGYDFAV